MFIPYFFQKFTIEAISLEQLTKNIIPEIDTTQQQEQEWQQQKEEILEAGKRSESYGKRVAHLFEQRPEKNNEMPPPPAVTTTAPSKPKSFMPTAKSVMDARVTNKRAEKKKPGFKNNQAKTLKKWM